MVKMAKNLTCRNQPVS